MTRSAPTLPALLGCQSYFSEGRSTVSPSRLVRLAAERGFTHVGLADYLSVSGAVELSQRAREARVKAVIGCMLPVLFAAHGKAPEETFPLVLLARNRAGYAVLCELITEIKMGGLDALPLASFQDRTANLSCLTGGRHGLPSVLLSGREVPMLYQRLKALRQRFPGSLYLQLSHDAAPDDKRRLSSLRGLARDLELPVVAAPEIRMGGPEEYPLLDALTCARLGIDVETPHAERPRNDSNHVWTPEDWAKCFPFPDAVLNTRRLAEECTFDLLPERLSSPVPSLPVGMSAQDVLEDRAWSAVADKYPPEQHPAVRQRLRSELGTVRELEMAGFFLTACEVTDYCRAHGIVAAGRGSAAGSVPVLPAGDYPV